MIVCLRAKVSNCRVLSAALQDARMTADSLPSAVSRHPFEGRVHELDVPPGIGHDNALSNLFDGRPQSLALGIILLAHGKVTNIATDHLTVIHQVYIADKLHGNGHSIAGFQRQILIADVFILLQGFESVPGSGDVFEHTDFPDIMSEQFIIQIPEQLQQVRIDINHPARSGIKDQDVVLCGFKEPAVALLRILQLPAGFLLIQQFRSQLYNPPVKFGIGKGPACFRYAFGIVTISGNYSV